MVFLAPRGVLLVIIASAAAEPACGVDPNSPSSDEVCLLQQFLHKGTYLKTEATPTDEGMSLVGVNSADAAASENTVAPTGGPVEPPAGNLKTEYDDNKCMDYNFNNNNVYMHSCHADDNQQWVFTGQDGPGTLKTQHDEKCLDYNFNTGNVYMLECNGGKNQLWHINPDGSMGTSYDSKCLDFNYDTNNVYMYDCHGEANQIWVHPQRTQNAALAARVDPTAAPETPSPTLAPTEQPTAEPTASPTPKPTLSPTAEPTAAPTPSPTPAPTFAPVDCVVGDWSAFSECDSICGGGLKFRNRTIAPAKYGGLACAENTTEDAVECNMDPCPVDCDMGEWTPWGECSASCGKGRTKRTRKVETKAAHGGEKCGSKKENMACNDFPCPTEPTAPPATPEPATPAPATPEPATPAPEKLSIVGTTEPAKPSEPTAAPPGYEEVPVIVQLNVVQKQFEEMQAHPQATATGIQTAFAMHVGLENQHVAIDSIDPSIGEFHLNTDFSLLKIGESDKGQTAAVTVLVGLRALVAEDRLNAFQVKITSTKNSQAELDDLTDLVNQQIAVGLPSGTTIEVMVTAINPSPEATTSTAAPTPLPTPRPTTKGNIVHHWTGANPRPSDCCGENPIQGDASSGQCHEVGVDIPIRTGSTISLFDDNVQMSNVYKFFMETHCTDTAHGQECTYVEITDPDFNHHNFEVGVSKIKIQGFDISGNKHECIKTLFVHDKEPPAFTTPPDQASKKLIQHVSDKSCTVKNEAPFKAYEELSFVPSASDNCDRDVEIVKFIYDTDGKLLYDSKTGDPNGDFEHGPGEYKMVYQAIDDYSLDLPAPVGGSTLKTNHSVQLILDDVDAPTEISHCPDDIQVFIEPNEIETAEGVVNWTVPEVVADNCFDIVPVPNATEINNTVPGQKFPVGTTLVKYIFKDGAEPPNIYPEECKFTVTVTQKKNPVKLTCPEDTEVVTLTNAAFGIVRWETPPATQGQEKLDVIYPQGVYSGMPFPFGKTEVKVKAVGTLAKGQDGELPFAECFFTVTVVDTQDPKCDSREITCAAGSATDAVKPYHMCGGPQLSVQLDDGYEQTFEYSILGVLETPTYPESGCCNSGMDVEHVCDVTSETAGTETRVCVPHNFHGDDTYEGM